MGKVDKKLDAAKENDRAGQIYNRVMSNTFHVAIQKGRIVGRMEAAGKSVEEIAKAVSVPVESVIVGRMEAAGKSVEEIAKAVSVPVESVKKMLEEDPNQYINKWHEEVSSEKEGTKS